MVVVVVVVVVVVQGTTHSEVSLPLSISNAGLGSKGATGEMNRRGGGWERAADTLRSTTSLRRDMGWTVVGEYQPGAQI